MGSYYYLDDPKSQMGYTPVSEDEYVSAILSIAKKNGIANAGEDVYNNFV